MNDFTIRDAHDADFDDAYSDSEGAESTSRAESTSTTASAASISPSLRKKISRMRGKILFNGDGSAGKTCFLIRATSGQFPTDYVPTVLADYSANIRCNKYDVILNILLWDTFGRSDYDRLRPLSYPGTDLMVLCFDVTSRVQFDNVFSKYIPEVTHHVPTAKLVLLGLKSDLRNNEEVAKKVAQRGLTMVAREEAEEQAAKFKMPYFEVTALEDAAGVSATLQAFASLLVERRLPRSRSGDDKKGLGLFGLVKRLFSGWSAEKPEEETNASA
jgi:small GTP-binding protein